MSYLADVWENLKNAELLPSLFWLVLQVAKWGTIAVFVGGFFVGALSIAGIGVSALQAASQAAWKKIKAIRNNGNQAAGEDARQQSSGNNQAENTTTNAPPQTQSAVVRNPNPKMKLLFRLLRARKRPRAGGLPRGNANPNNNRRIFN
jgi:hypothetical protein